MSLSVQKFGGTSVADTPKILAAARKASRSQQQGHQVVMVVSAMGHNTDLLIDLAKRHAARDTTARGTVLEELATTSPRRSQYQPGDEIPERSIVYRWAKKYAFNDFGAYGRHFDAARYRDPDLELARNPHSLPVVKN